MFFFHALSRNCWVCGAEVIVFVVYCCLLFQDMEWLFHEILCSLAETEPTAFFSSVSHIWLEWVRQGQDWWELWLVKCASKLDCCCML